MDISVNLGENVTGIGYQFFDSAGLIGSRVTTGINNPVPGVYYKAAVSPGVGAIGIYWDNTAGDVTASEVFETNAKPANVVELLGTAWLTPAVAGTPDVNTKTISNDAVTSSAVAASAVTEIQSGLATSSEVTTVAGYIDTEVAAIKAKTDNLPAAPAAVGDIPSAATIAGAVRTNLTTELGRIDAAVSSRMATFTYTAPDNSSVAAIKVVTDKLGTAVELDGSVYRFTTNALEMAPAGGGGGGGGASAETILKQDFTGLTGEPVYCLLNAQRLLLNVKTQRTGFIDVMKEDGVTTAFSIPVTESGPSAKPVASTGVPTV